MAERPRRCTHLDYCQCLLSGEINFTMTHLAAHTDAFSHDAVTRHLADGHVTPHSLWEQVRGDIVPSAAISCATIRCWTSKNHIRNSALVRRQ